MPTCRIVSRAPARVKISAARLISDDATVVAERVFAPSRLVLNRDVDYGHSVREKNGGCGADYFRDYRWFRFSSLQGRNGRITEVKIVLALKAEI